MYHTALQEYFLFDFLFEDIANPCRESHERVPLLRMDFGHTLEPYLSRLGNHVPFLHGPSEIDVERDLTSSGKKGPHGNIRIPLVTIVSPASESVFDVPRLRV